MGAVIRACALNFAAMALTAVAFTFPTANHTLLTPGKEAEFFVPTVIGQSWESGSFGCTRSGGGQFHEGVDIRALERDRRGEPTDPILAAGAGEVAYVNRKSGLSNYGNYIILRHDLGGTELLTLYAHLASIDAALKPGVRVAAGQALGVMGRTSNTSSGIPRERAHVHFEIGFQINERFPQWYAKYRKGLRNDHGAWNGQNMIGLDPAALFRDQARLGNKFSIRDHIRSKPELLRVFIRTSRLSLAERSGPLVLKNPRAESEGVHGYEIALSAFGVPLEIIPRSQSEYPVTQRMTLLRVNDSVARTEDCRKLVRARSGKWELGTAGSDLLELMAY